MKNNKTSECLLIDEGVVATCPLKRKGFCGDFNQQSICARPRQEEQQDLALNGFGTHHRHGVGTASIVEGVFGTRNKSTGSG